jgi:hypothetical protein
LDDEIGSLGADTGYSTAHFKKHGKPIIESLFQPVCCGANKKMKKWTSELEIYLSSIIISKNLSQLILSTC